VILLYGDLQWTAAESCRGNGSGSGSDSRSGSGNECSLDTVSAQVGFSAGNGSFRYYTLNGSGTDEVLKLNSTSNINRPGVWIFKVDGDDVVSGGKSQS